MIVSIDLNAPMAIFPLPGCVMIPHTILPLHIFEPRYRQMTVDSLDSAGIISMGMFRDDVSKDEYLNGRPALRPYVCVGQIQDYQILDDGRFVFLLGGVCRATIQEEVPFEPYRMVRVKPVPEDEVPAANEVGLRKQIGEMLRDKALDKLDAIGKLRELLTSTETLDVIVDVLFATAVDNAEQRYNFLAEPNPERRAAQFLQALDALRTRPTEG